MDTRIGRNGETTRYVVRWDPAGPGGWRIWDSESGAWTLEPRFGKEHIAADVAGSLNRRAAEAAATSRLWTDRRF